MTINIGATSQATLSLVSVGPSRSIRGVASNQFAEKPGQLVREKEVPAIRAGFGEGTLSPSGAALKTLDANLRAAKQLVPTVDELRDRARIAQARREDAVAVRELEPVEFRQPERVRPEASPAVRNFFESDAPPAERPEKDAAAAETSETPPPAIDAPATPGSRLNLQA
jgi:hypothetical protein